MTDISESLRDRLQKLLAQVERDSAALHENATDGKAVCSDLFDSLTSTLHNLDQPQAVQKRGD